MNNKRKIIADTLQKLGLGFMLAAFIQADHAGETVLLAALGIILLIAAVRFTIDEE